ncbi:hypothetical protein D3C78_1108420 [compost metagenome]
MAPAIAYGKRLAPTADTSACTMRPKAPVACSSEPITTPKPMSRPTLPMISPKPPVMAVSVPAKPTPLASPR